MNGCLKLGTAKRRLNVVFWVDAPYRPVCWNPPSQNQSLPCQAR